MIEDLLKFNKYSIAFNCMNPLIFNEKNELYVLKNSFLNENGNKSLVEEWKKNGFNFKSSNLFCKHLNEEPNHLLINVWRFKNETHDQFIAFNRDNPETSIPLFLRTPTEIEKILENSKIPDKAYILNSILKIMRHPSYVVILKEKTTKSKSNTIKTLKVNDQDKAVINTIELL